MLHRSYSLLSFLLRNVNGSCREQFYILQIGLAKRHTSTFIKQKFIHVISNSLNQCHNKHANARWTRTPITRLASSDAKGKIEKVEKEEKMNKLNETEAKHQVDLTQRIVELKGENLGNLKERVLNVEATTSAINDKNDEAPTTPKKEKKKKDEKKIAADETAKKSNLLTN